MKRGLQSVSARIQVSFILSNYNKKCAFVVINVTTKVYKLWDMHKEWCDIYYLQEVSVLHPYTFLYYKISLHQHVRQYRASAAKPTNTTAKLDTTFLAALDIIGAGPGVITSGAGAAKKPPPEKTTSIPPIPQYKPSTQRRQVPIQTLLKNKVPLANQNKVTKKINTTHQLFGRKT